MNNLSNEVGRSTWESGSPDKLAAKHKRRVGHYSASSLMRHTYLRFVTAVIDRDSGRRRGLFHAASDLLDAHELSKDEVSELRALQQWFDDNLAKPDRFARSRSPRAAPRAISWFKSSAVEHIRRIRTLARILESHGILTELVSTQRPGYIVFEDEHQVAALPFAETRT